MMTDLTLFSPTISAPPALIWLIWTEVRILLGENRVTYLRFKGNNFRQPPVAQEVMGH